LWLRRGLLRWRVVLLSLPARFKDRCPDPVLTLMPSSRVRDCNNLLKMRVARKGKVELKRRLLLGEADPVLRVCVSNLEIAQWLPCALA